MKKITALVLAIITAMTCMLTFASCGDKKNMYEGLETLDCDLFETEFYGVAFRKGSDLAVRLDNMFKTYFENGKVNEIGKKYDVDSSLVSAFEKGTSTSADTSDFDYIVGKKTLKVGVTVFEGMDYQDENGKWIGFEADMANEFAKSLGVTAEFIEIDWDNKLFDLESKNIDCIWNGMTVTEAILNACEVSGTYMVNGQVIVMKKGAFKTVADLEGKQIAVEGGSAGASQAMENFKKSTVKEVAAQTDALLEVAAGTSDACIIDYVLAKSLLPSMKAVD